MPLLMEGLGGSIWPPTLAHTSEKQALGTPACPGWHTLGSGAGPVLHLGELALAEAGPLTHRGVASVLTQAPAYCTSELPPRAKHSMIQV